MFNNSPKNGRYYTIAIDGRGASGKSTFSEALVASLYGFAVLHGDDYFEPIEGSNVWGAFNNKRFNSDVVDFVKKGQDFKYKPYDWSAEPHISSRFVKPKKGLIIERSFLFDVSIDWDLRIWVETPREVCLERGVARDVDGGLNDKNVKHVWRDVWQPKEDKYIARTKPQKIADFIISGVDPFDEQIKVIIKS